MDNLIVTVHNRPQAMLRCLRSIAGCNLDNIQVVVSEDRRTPNLGMDDLIQQVCQFLKFTHIRRTDCTNTWDNIYKSLCEFQSDFVYFIEDDFVVEPELIQFHRKLHKQFSPFISCADTIEFKSDNPSEVILSHSLSTVRAGCMTRADIRKIVSNQWCRHFEEVVQNHLIEHKLLSVFPTLARAHDTGQAGANQPAAHRPIVLNNPPTPDNFSIIDHRESWERDFAAQARFGFTTTR